MFSAGILGIVILGLILSIKAIIPVKSPIKGYDFQSYWSASYLLGHRQNFTDPDLMLATEREQTGWTADYPIMTWNPPWLLVILLPYASLPYRTGEWLWFLTSIILVFTSSIWVWRTSCPKAELPGKMIWLGPILAFLFSPTLVALMAGQINVLVYFGLAFFLIMILQEKDVLAGMGLALTFVKPHLVYVTVPFLLLALAANRRWRVWLGFGGLLLALTSITFVLRPSFLSDYSLLWSRFDLLNWETPTLGGILTAVFGWSWSKWMGIVILPVSLIFLWPLRQKFSWPVLVSLTLLISVSTAPFGWGYDVIVLLVPLIQIVAWIVVGKSQRLFSSLMIVLLAAIDLVLFYLRVITINELYFFWAPLVFGAMYIWAMLNDQRRGLSSRSWN